MGVCLTSETGCANIDIRQMQRRHMDLIIGFSVLIGAVWFSGYGAAMIVQQHGRYAAASGRVLRWFWRRDRVQIIWFAIGFAFALLLLAPRGAQ